MKRMNLQYLHWEEAEDLFHQIPLNLSSQVVWHQKMIPNYPFSRSKIRYLRYIRDILTNTQSLFRNMSIWDNFINFTVSCISISGWGDDELYIRSSIEDGKLLIRSFNPKFFDQTWACMTKDSFWIAIPTLFRNTILKFISWGTHVFKVDNPLFDDSQLVSQTKVRSRSNLMLKQRIQRESFEKLRQKSFLRWDTTWKEEDQFK